MRVPSLDEIFAMPSLPSLPGVAVQVLELSENADISISEIAKAIEHDQGLSVRVLRTVNSPYYGLATPCPTLTRALMYLGLWSVKSLVLGFSLVDTAREAAQGFDLVAYWRRCVFASAASRQIALTTGACDPDEAALAALMKNIGMLALNTAMRGTYAKLLSRAGAQHEDLSAIEREALGFDHADIGAKMAERWRMPQQFAEAIRLHHRPDEAAGNALAQTLVLAGYLAEALISPQSDEALARFSHYAEESFGVDAAACTRLLEETAAKSRELASLLQVQTGEAPDIRAILARREEANMMHQITMQRETEHLKHDRARLAQQARTDGLTGIGNRNSFDHELERRYDEARESGKPLGVLLVDADRFKQVNDTLGHQAGDAVLIQLASRLAMAIAEAGMVYRYGGEEFAAILPGATREEVARLAEAARSAVEKPDMCLAGVPGLEGGVAVTTSVGAALFEPGAPSLLTSTLLLVDAADRALYAAKHAGRNCVRIYRAAAASSSASRSPALSSAHPESGGQPLAA